MPKAVIKFVFEVYGMDCWRTYLTHAHICDNVRVQSTTEWIVFSPFSRFRRFRDFAFSFFPVSVLGVFAFSRFRVPPAASPRPGHRFRVHRLGSQQKSNSSYSEMAKDVTKSLILCFQELFDRDSTKAIVEYVWNNLVT